MTDTPRLTQVTPRQLRVIATTCLTHRLPLLITGAPGIGKSDIVASVLEEQGMQLILSHPAVSDPTDYKGFPKLDGERARFIPFDELHDALTATQPTGWFFDDLGQAANGVQAACMQLFLARRVNGHRLPEHVTFIAATNRRTDRAGVGGLLEPVKSRFVTIVELVATVDDWCEWALTQDWMPIELIAFLRFRPDLLCQFTPSADLTNCPLPRTWASVGRLVAAEIPESVLPAVVAGAVGDGAAVEFLAFRRMYQSLPSLDAIIMNPDSAPIPDAPGALYATVTGLAARANELNWGRVLTYTTRVMQAEHGEFAALLVRDATKRTPDLLQTAAFVRMMAGPLGALVGGATSN